MSHRLILLPRSLEVQATVLPALDDRPPAAGRLHVAIHLHRGERRSAKRTEWEECGKAGAGMLIAPTGLCISSVILSLK